MRREKRSCQPVAHVRYAAYNDIDSSQREMRIMCARHGWLRTPRNLNWDAFLGAWACYDCGPGSLCRSNYNVHAMAGAAKDSLPISGQFANLSASVDAAGGATASGVSTKFTAK